MNLEELSARFRTDADDTIVPYLFSDEEVAAWLNEAQDEAAVRARLIFEDSDPDVCQIGVTANTSVYTTHKALFEITKATFTPTDGDPIDLYITDRVQLDREMPGWRSSTGEPEALIQDDKTVRIVPTPDVAGVLAVEGHRLPLETMANDDDEPEIQAIHHRHLIYWALHCAFSKPDSETVDKDKSAVAEAAFIRYFGRRPDAETRKETQANRPQHNQSHW